MIFWSGKRGSNPRHQAWEACTLPTELFPPYKHNKRIKERNQVVFYHRPNACPTVPCLRSHAAKSQGARSHREATEEGRWKLDIVNRGSRSLVCRSPDLGFTDLRPLRLTISDLQFCPMLCAIHYELDSAFPVIAETLFKNRRNKIVNRRMIVGYDNGMSLIDKFFH
jgi:hypothetical protein